MTVTECINEYLQHKRSTGLRYEREGRDFERLRRQVGNRPIKSLALKDTERFLACGVVGSQSWHSAFLRLSRFFDYWIVRGGIDPPAMPPRPRRSTPVRHRYVFSRDEVQRLIEAVPESQRMCWCALSADVVQAVLKLLYGTGITVTEAIALQRSNVDLRRRTLTVLNPKFGWERTIPIGRDMRSILAAYLKTVDRRVPDVRLFTNKEGLPIVPFQLTESFTRVRRIAQVGNSSFAATAPRLTDFRRTFAVHRIQAWIAEGADLNRALPALATYLGHCSLETIETYMDLTPEWYSRAIAALSERGSILVDRSMAVTPKTCESELKTLHLRDVCVRNIPDS